MIAITPEKKEEIAKLVIDWAVQRQKFIFGINQNFEDDLARESLYNNVLEKLGDRKLKGQ